MNKGFIGRLILIIIALALLYYFFDWSIFDVLNSEKGQQTISYVKEILGAIWYYIGPTVMLVYHKILVIIEAIKS